MSRALRGIVLAVRCSRRDDQRRPRIPAIGTVLRGEFLVAFEIEVALLEDLLHDGDDAPAGFISGVLPFQSGPGRQHRSVIAMRALLRAQRQAAPEPIEHNIWRGRSLLQSVEALPKAL